MKRILIIASAALVAMCACTKNEADVVVGQDQEITFEVANYLSQTKAEDSPLAYYSDGHFGTFAFQVPEGQSWATATTKSVFMDNVEIYAQSGVWKAEKAYYWPKTGSLTFASYSPVDSDSACGATASCGNDAVVKITGWEVETDESEQAKDYTEDLMWADVISDQTNNNADDKIFTEGVKTLFHHALAKVNLKAKMTETAAESAYDFAIYVTKVIVDGLEYTGDYTVGTGWVNRDTDERAGDAAIYTNTASYTIGGTYSEGTDVLGTDDDSAVDLIKNYFVLPQTLADASTIELEYTIVTIDADGKIVLVETTTTDEIKINTMGLDKWDENKNITYTVTIAPTQENPILFDPAVVDWENEDPEDIKVADLKVNGKWMDYGGIL